MIYKKIEIAVGGYAVTSDREAEPIVMQYLTKGYHTVTDDCVPVENSLLFFNALRKFKIPVEMHLYPVGGHGLSLANEETSYEDGRCIQKECQTWMELACKWIENIKQNKIIKIQRRHCAAFIICVILKYKANARL